MTTKTLTNEKKTAQRLARLIALHDRQARRDASRPQQGRSKHPQVARAPRLWADAVSERRGRFTPAADCQMLLHEIALAAVLRRPSCARNVIHVVLHGMPGGKGWQLMSQESTFPEPPTCADTRACRAYDRALALLTRAVDAPRRVIGSRERVLGHVA